MTRKITEEIHERVDDLPILIAILFKKRVAELIDKHFPTNGNRRGASPGQMCVIWLTFIISRLAAHDGWRRNCGAPHMRWWSTTENGRSRADSSKRLFRTSHPHDQGKEVDLNDY